MCFFFFLFFFCFSNSQLFYVMMQLLFLKFFYSKWIIFFLPENRIPFSILIIKVPLKWPNIKYSQSYYFQSYQCRFLSPYIFQTKTAFPWLDFQIKPINYYLIRKYLNLQPVQKFDLMSRFSAVLRTIGEGTISLKGPCNLWTLCFPSALKCSAPPPEPANGCRWRKCLTLWTQQRLF